MMKRVLLFAITALLALAACNKDDDYLFDKTPNERMYEELEKYETALLAAQYGWNAQLVTGTGAIYNFHFAFDANNRVKTFADIDTTSSFVERESSYRLKALRVPALLFDTYTYLHILADPDAAVNNGDYGAGLYSDFEFTLDTLAGDSIKLTGRQQGSKLVLRRSSQADYQAWTGGAWRSSVLFQTTSAYIRQYFKVLVVNGVTYEMRINPAARIISFIWRDGNTPRTFTTSYFFSNSGVEFTEPLVNGGTTIRFLSNLNWNAALSSFSLSVNGNQAGAIAGAIAPVVNDTNGPLRWWSGALGNGYWRSFTGFQVNGVIDAFKVRSQPNFQYLVFLSEFDVEQGVPFDLLGHILNGPQGGGIYYGAGFNPPVFANGKIIFDYVYDLGGPNIPSDSGPYFNTAVQFTDPLGYYLVQTSQTSYDMVNARDARTWITWTK